MGNAYNCRLSLFMKSLQFIQASCLLISLLSGVTSDRLLSFFLQVNHKQFGTMSEAEFEREAAQLFQNLGLQLGKETLDFFTSESVHKSDWKSVLKRPSPSPPRRRRITVGDRPKRQKQGEESSGIKENEKPRNGSVFHFKKVLSNPPRSPASSSSGSRRHRRVSEGSRAAGGHSQENKAKPTSTEKHPNALHITTAGMNTGGSGQAKPKNGILQHTNSLSTPSTTEVSPHSTKPLVNETDSPLQTQAVPTRHEPQRNGFAYSTSNKRERTSPVNSSNTQVLYSRKPSLKILSVTTTSSSIVRSVKDRSDDSSVGSPESSEKLMSPESIEKRATPEKPMFPARTERRISTEKRKSLEIAAKPVPPEHAKKRWSQQNVDRRVSPEDNEKPPQLPPKRRPRMHSKPSENSLEFEAPRVLNAPRSSTRRNPQTQKQSSIESNSSESRETAVPSSHWIYDHGTSPEPFVARTKSPEPSLKERRPDHSIYRLPSESSRSAATPSPVERESVSTSATTGDLRRYSRSDSLCSSESGNYNQHTYAILEPPGFSYFGSSRASPSPEGGDLRWYDSMDNLAVSPEDLLGGESSVAKNSSSSSETESEQRKTALDRSTQFQSPSQMPTVSALATNTIQALSTLMEALTPSTEHLDRLPYLANAPLLPSPDFESADDDIDSGSVTISSGPISPATSPEVGQPAYSTSPEAANRPVSITPDMIQLRSTNHSTPLTRSANQTPSNGLTIETDFPVTTYAETDEEFFG